MMQSFLKESDIFGTLIYDIETVPLTKTFQELEETNYRLSLAWLAEAKKIREYKKTLESDNMTDQELYEIYGGLYPEFGRVIAISGGVFNLDNDGNLDFYIRNYFSEDEEELLTQFNSFLEKLDERKRGFVLGGYNIKVFDNPFLLKRYVINGMKIPHKLFSIGKKPWEINDFDLAERWRVGTFDKIISLDTLTSVFDVESPKEHMDGSQVSAVFYSEDEDKAEKISDYCQGDVEAVAHIFIKLLSSDDMNEFEIKNI